METNDKLVEVLNDLVEINNDRIKGYENALKEVENETTPLRPVFDAMKNQSQSNKNELIAAISATGGKVDNDSSVLGKLHRMWMDLRTAFSAKDGKTTLETCEFGEDAILKAYDEALGSDAEMNADTRQLLVKQKEDLKKSHDKIKAMRDTAEAVS